ncbi:MAG TPA: 30S ribosomal protein S16 [Egibacteraceae bacterium]|nr:30S ribosomal protein S16 [Egibacteraceae bacterium]
MAVKMRLRREGKKKQPFYRVVVADVRSPRDGRFIEDIGFYQPLHEPSTISIDRERALYWLRNGVQPSDAVVNLLRIEGIWEEFKPGDPGKDRSAKHAAREAARKAKEAEREAAEARAAAERAEAEAAAQAQAEADAAPEADAADASADAEADAAAAQAHEENAQPEPGPTEDTGAVDEATGEVTQEQ